MIETQQNPEVAALLEIIQQKDLQIQKLQNQLEQLLRTVYGKKSERFGLVMYEIREGKIVNEWYPRSQ